jgi:uncharacterized membrane protein
LRHLIGLGIGMIAGLRARTAPGAIARAAWLGWPVPIHRTVSKPVPTLANAARPA